MLITITGPTGSGKSTLTQAMQAEGVSMIPTWTTRPLRPGEEGRGDIVHVSRAEMISQEMLETAQYDGHLYGTPMTRAVVEALKGKRDAMKILEPAGLAALREKVTRWAGPDIPRLGHIYVDIDPFTAKDRLLARCQGEPTDADLRRLQRVTRECIDWPKACVWSHVVDNNGPEADLSHHAREALANTRAHLEATIAGASRVGRGQPAVRSAGTPSM